MTWFLDFFEHVQKSVANRKMPRYILNMFKLDEKQNKKSDQTRQRLYQVAASLFAKNGFESTTMRAIAKEAGVALGATYYYFSSKEDFVHEFYKQSHTDHEIALGGFLFNETSFAKRLHRVVTSKIEVAMPYKSMATALFRVAANPDSPLSPFGPQSLELRLQSLELFQHVVNGSQDQFHPQIKKILPEYLWLYQMGIILYWVYDQSHEAKQTFLLIDKTVPLIDSLNKTIQSPLAAPFRKKIISVLESFAPQLGQEFKTE